MDRTEKIEQLKMDYFQCFETEGGKRVLEDLRSKSTIARSGVPSDKLKMIDVNRLCYDEGQRTVILYIEKMLIKEKKHG